MSSLAKPLGHIRSMLGSMRKRLSGEGGNVLLIVVLAMPVIMAVSAFAIDVANVWAARQKVQSTADAAALAGAQELNGSTGEYGNASSYATYYVKGNAAMNIAANDAAANAPDVVAPASAAGNDVKVTVTQNVPMFFSGLFGLHDATVSASATATNQSVIHDPVAPTNQTVGDGSISSGDGWGTFCASDGTLEGSNGATLVNAQGGGCYNNGQEIDTIYGGANNDQVAAKLVYGGVDISSTNFMPGHTDLTTGQTTMMFDLTSTCVEVSWGAGCDANADGEMQLEYDDLVPGASYTFSFWLSANTDGLPEEKPMAVAVGDTQFWHNLSIPAMAVTTGNSTSYPLESSQYASDLLAYSAFAYAAKPSAYNSGTHPWVQETVSFTQGSSQTAYVALGSLENCEGDKSPNPITSGIFTSGLTDGSGTLLASGTNSSSIASALSSVATLVPAQSYDNPGLQKSSTSKQGCRFGAAISDWNLTPATSNTVSLTR